MQRAKRCSIGLMAVVTLYGCAFDISDRVVDVEVTEAFSVQADVTTQTRLTLENINGMVRIVGDPDASTALVEGERRVGSDSRSDAEDFLERVSVEVVDRGAEILVKTRQPMATDGRQVTVHYDVVVPAHLRVHVRNINGEIDIQSLDSSVRVENVMARSP